MQKILVINSGSSSLKYQLFVLPSFSVLASGLVENIGQEHSMAHLSVAGDRCREPTRSRSQPVGDHGVAIALMTAMLRESGCLTDIHELAAIGHRVVHGGETFREPVRIDDTVLATIEQLSLLAPLHNPANLTGIRVAMEYAPQIPQVAVFDTAFHQTMPEHAYLYALPYDLYHKYHLRRYGFHGTSHRYVSFQAAQHLGRPLQELNIISMHLGNGASIAAIQKGECIDTSMGLTPLEGLIMGTRSGDFDPAILFYLSRTLGMTIDELDRMVNRESGLKGICGMNDMRDITDAAQQGEKRARLALEMFCYRLKKYIGGYLAILGRVDCLVFTGGIGENSALVRWKTCEGLAGLGICIDPDRNQEHRPGIIDLHAPEADSAILVVPTDEELAIAQQTLEVCRGQE